MNQLPQQFFCHEWVFPYVRAGVYSEYNSISVLNNNSVLKNRCAQLDAVVSPSIFPGQPESEACIRRKKHRLHIIPCKSYHRKEFWFQHLPKEPKRRTSSFPEWFPHPIWHHRNYPVCLITFSSSILNSIDPCSIFTPSTLKEQKLIFYELCMFLLTSSILYSGIRVNKSFAWFASYYWTCDYTRGN